MKLSDTEIKRNAKKRSLHSSTWGGDKSQTREFHSYGCCWRCYSCCCWWWWWWWVRIDVIVLVHHDCLAPITSLIEKKFFVGSRQALSTILAVNSRRRRWCRTTSVMQSHVQERMRATTVRQTPNTKSCFPPSRTSPKKGLNLGTLCLSEGWWLCGTAPVWDPATSRKGSGLKQTHWRAGESAAGPLPLSLTWGCHRLVG